MIKLKKYQADSIFNIINAIKVNKIKDSNIRKTVLKLMLESQRVQKKSQEVVEESRKRFFDDFEKEKIIEFQNALNNVLNLARKNDPDASIKENELSNTYSELYKAYINFSEFINSLQIEDIELNIDKVELDTFVDNMVDQNVDITAKELIILEPLFKNESENKEFSK